MAEGQAAATKVTTTITDRLPQDSQSGPEMGLLKWKIDREASLTGKKEKLKSQQLLVEKLRADSDEVRVESESIKAENQVLERTVATQVENLALVNKENGKSKFQLSQITKMMSCMASLNVNLKSLEQRQQSSQAELTNQLAQLSLEHGTKTRAAQDARKKKKEDFENGIKVFEAERKVLLENNENDKLILKQKEEEKKLMTIEGNTLASNKAQLTEELKLVENELQVFLEKDVVLTKEEGKLEDLRNVLNTKMEMVRKKESNIGSIQESVELKETELAKFREDTEIVRKENTSLQMKLATLEASGEETLEEKNNLHVMIENLSNEAATLSQDLEAVQNVLFEMESLQKLEEAAITAKVAAQTRVEELNKLERLKSSLDNESLQLSQEVHDLEIKVEGSKAEGTERKMTLKETEKVSSDFEETFKSQTGRREETAKKVESLKTQLDNEKSSHLLQVSVITEKDRKISAAKRELESLKQKLAKTEKSLMIWKAELETSESNSKEEEERAREIAVSRDLLKSEFEAKENERKELDEALQGQMRSIEEKREEGKSLGKEKKSSITKLEKLTKDVRQAEKKLEKKKTGYRLRTAKSADMEAKLSSLNSEIENLARKLEEDEEALKKLDDAQANLKQLKGVLTGLVTTTKKVKKEFTSSKRTLSSATKSRDKMKKQLGKTNESLASVQSNVESLQQQLNSRREEIKGLAKQKEDLDEKLKVFEEALEKDKERKEEMERLSKMKLTLEDELQNRSRELKGILVSKEREFKTGFMKKIEKDIEEKERLLQTKTKELGEKQEKLKVSSVVENLEISNQKLLGQVNKARCDLQSLEEELLQKMSGASSATLAPASTPENTGGLSKKPRFFKTPRSPAVYCSPLSPSPRKKLNTTETRQDRTLSQSVPSSPSSSQALKRSASRPEVRAVDSQRQVQTFLELMEFSGSSQSQ